MDEHAPSGQAGSNHSRAPHGKFVRLLEYLVEL
jgi:hypothetical protein